MNYKKRYCVGDCNFKGYFANQAGSGLADITVFRGAPYQRGRGFGTVFSKFGIPLLKFLGRHLLSTGVAVGSDMLAKRPIRETLKSRISESVKTAGHEGIDKIAKLVAQRGSGRLYKRRKTRISRKKPRKPIRRVKKRVISRRRKRRDIFA